MINYIVFVNKEKENIIVLDSEHDPKYSPDIGYEADPYWDWQTNNKELQGDYEVNFDIHKAFDNTGIYKVYGFDTSCDTPDGFCEGYRVDRVEKISEVIY